MEQRIEPRVLRGFRDTLPATALACRAIFRTAERVFASFGYVPIDTPALEYAEVLKGKGGEETDKQLFEFDDAGGRRVALRFDLTVPLARFVATHEHELAFPFRRYHIGTVWRGERPQRGRFREFIQCDADLVGATGPVADAEVLTLFSSLYAALDVGEVVIRINDRRVLNGLLAALELPGHATPVLRALDKLDKIGAAAVRAEMVAAGVPGESADRILAVMSSDGDSNEATLARLEEAVGATARGREGVEGLRAVLRLTAEAGVPAGRLRLDPAIARGLDYYTGLVFEAQLVDLPGIGSVGAGGRYDNLAGLYTATRLPGVGCSLGVDRLLAALEELGRIPRGAGGTAVLVTHPETGDPGPAFALAAALRRAGLSTEMYPEPRRHATQMRFADRKGTRLVLTVDADGSAHGKDLATGESFHAPDAATVVQQVRARLGAG
jgi:histidyl-tRNA synthetase